MKNENPEINNFQDDEIDLFELWQGLQEERNTIIGTVLAIVLVALIYVFNVTPVYKSEVYLLPPTVENVLPMNELAIVLNTNTNTNTPETVFNDFQRKLNSRQVLRTIFNKYQLLEVYAKDMSGLSETDKVWAEKAAFAKFVKDFALITPKKNSLSKGVSVSLSLPLTELKVAEVLNNLITQAQEKTVNQIYGQLLAERNDRSSLLLNAIESARSIALDRRLDRIAQLKEAIIITKQLGIKKPVSSGPTMNVNNVNVKDSRVTALYLLGSDFLEAEKKVLESRQNDDAFIPNLRSLQEQLQRLQNLKIDKTDFDVATIDQQAVFGEKVKPKKVLILAVAGVLGLMLGVFIALIRRAVKKRSELANQTA